MHALAVSAALLTGLAAAAPAPSPTNDVAAAAVPTLVDGWYFVRAVVEPNFHSYLQAESQPTATPSPSPAAEEADAILDVPELAGQFNIVDGQLVFNTAASSSSSSTQAEGELYMHVEQSSETPVPRKLRTWFSAEKNDYGEFVFQGDTVTWRVEGLQRPNEAAWLVCEEQKLFVNTGAYGYETPEGCADQTIHSYGGSTPDV
ncbi:hypothetical protein N3K66_009018 [Trichothecium roseum]|uniref:Uncharacterized protein n=1 Tax=Trichothecium roseum TaxID=47278 RepID=A0ACC0UPT9_9HYPO|nr:hypothetical protein N3K66_009018 [Trichothecium roseum]